LKEKKPQTDGYEYNLFEIQRTHIKAKYKLPVGKQKIEIEIYVERKPAGSRRC
jgi:arylsulfatase